MLTLDWDQIAIIIDGRLVLQGFLKPHQDETCKLWCKYTKLECGLGSC